MGKVYTRFQTETAQKPNPMGRHIPICTPPPRDLGKKAAGQGAQVKFLTNTVDSR